MRVLELLDILGAGANLAAVTEEDETEELDSIGAAESSSRRDELDELGGDAAQLKTSRFAVASRRPSGANATEPAHAGSLTESFACSVRTFASGIRCPHDNRCGSAGIGSTGFKHPAITNVPTWK